MGMTTSTIIAKNGLYMPVCMNIPAVRLCADRVRCQPEVAPNDMGDIVAVKVTYEKSSCLSCFLYSDFVRLQHVEIKEGERQKK